MVESADDIGLVHGLHFVRVVVQDAGQDILVVLADLGGAADDGRGAAEVPEVAGDGDAAGQEVGDFHQGAPFPGVRVGGGLRDGVHRGGHYIVVGEVGDGLAHGHIGHQVAHGLVDGGAVVGALVPGGKARIFQPFRLAQGVADAMPVMLVAGGNQHPAVLAGVGAGRGRRRFAASGFDAGAVIGGNGDFGVAVSGVGEAGVDGLAFAGGFALVQGGQGADGGVQGGSAVDNRHAGPDGRHPLLAGNHGDAGHGLADGVVADLLAVGAELPVGGHIDHHHAGVQLVQHIVAETHGVNGAGAEVLDQDVGDLDQLAEDFLALLFAEVDAEAFLAAVVLDPVGGLLADPGGVVAGFLAAEPFHLDDFGAQAGQHLGAAGAGLVPPQVDYANSIQRAFRFCHDRFTSKSSCGCGFLLGGCRRSPSFDGVAAAGGCRLRHSTPAGGKRQAGVVSGGVAD